MFRPHLRIFVLIISSLLGAGLAGCSSDAGQAAQIGYGSCSATGTVSSGNPTLPNSMIQLSNVAVSVNNAVSGGTFTITIAGIGTFTSTSPNYSLPSVVSVQTGASGGYSGTVSVLNSADQSSYSCALSVAGASGIGVTSVMQVTASPAASIAVGTTVTLTAADPSVPGASFTFLQQSFVSGVSMQIESAATAVVASSVATSVTIIVTENNSATSQSVAVPLTFSGTGIGTGTAPAILCQLTHSPAVVVVGQPVSFSVIPIGASGPVEVVQFDPGEASSSPVLLPQVAPIQGSYEQPGSKLVTMVATVNGVPCNNGAPFFDSVQVSPPPLPAFPQRVLSSIMFSSSAGPHIPGGLACPLGLAPVTAVEDCAGGFCSGASQVCAASANVMVGANDPTPVVADLAMTPEGYHQVGGGGCPPGYTIVGSAADCGGGTCYGDQNLCALVIPAFALTANQPWVQNVWMTPLGTHVPGGLGCPAGYSPIGSFADCGGRVCAGDQLVCIQQGN